MKNIFFNWNTFTKSKLLLFSFFLFIAQMISAQTISSVVPTNGTCQANASIEVTTTGAEEWTAEIVKTTAGSVPATLTIPNSGNVSFSSLSPGSYNISITNGFTTIQYANNPVVLITSYVNNLAVLNSTTGTPPTCTNSSDATYTVNISGGIGPFVFKLAATDGTQVVTGTSATRSFTFTGLPGGVVRNLSITDQVNGGAGCEYTITQQVSIPAQTAAGLGYGQRSYNYIRECVGLGNTAKLFINLSNLTTARKNLLLQSGNAKITIAGIDYPLTYISNENRFTYDPVTTGGPVLTNGLLITTTFNWGCGILTRTSNVAMNDDFLNVFSTVIRNPDCSAKYKITVIGDADASGGERNVYFCETNTVVVERKNSSGLWDVVSGSNITPDPATLTNGLNTVGAQTSVLASQSNAFYVYQTGEYKVTVTDAYHTLSRIITITDNIPINSLNAYTRTSLLSGTVGFEVNTNSFQGLFPMTVKIERVDAQTEMTISPTQPSTLAQDYSIKFPIEKTFSSNPSWFNIMDLPPGSYKVTFTDGCTAVTGTSKTQTISLNNVAGYNPQVSVVEGCVNSNSVNYALNPIANSTYLPNFTQLKTPNGTTVKQNQNNSGVFTGVTSGNYIVNFTSAGASGSVFSAALNRFGPFEYNTPITVAPYQNFEISTSTIKCNLNDAMGVVSAQAVNGTITYPLTFSLYSTSNPSTPIQGPFTVSSPVNSYDFIEVPEGNYFIRVTSPCFSQDKNVTVSSISNVPIAKVSNLTICPGSPTTLAILSPSSSMYDITWKANGAIVGTGMPLKLNPTVTTEYTAYYTLKGCVNPTIYESKVTVNVTVNVDETKTVSDIDLCFNANPNRNIIVSNSQLNFTYELTDSNGFSFTPTVTAAGTGNDLVLAIPSTVTLIAGTFFKVKVGNGNAGCTGFLTDVASITARKSNQSLAVSSISPVCPGTVSKIIVEGFESGVTYQIQKNGITLTSGITEQNNGFNKEFTIQSNQLVAGTNTFKVTTSGAGCSNGELVNPAVIIVNQAPAITGTLTPIVINGCDDVAAPSAYTTVAQLEAEGVTITDAETADNLLVITYSDSPMVGTLSKVFTRTYTIKDPSCSGSSTVTQNITLNITTPPAPTIITTTATTFCQGGSVELKSSAVTGNQWYYDGVLISGATAQTHTATVAGTYTVKNSVTNTNTIVCTSPASAGVVVVVNPSVAAVPKATTIANNCPLETVDLASLEPAPATGIEFEWWTGTATSRGTQIMNTTNYNTSGAVFLWSKSTSDACYSLEGQRVDVVITPCCVANVGIIENTNPTGLVHYAPADINGYEHKNSSTPNKTVYVLVNELDQKIKYVNTVLPQFTGVVAGNYKLHALVFGPTVNPTGIVVGNAINQIQIPDYCGSTASYAVQVVPGNCISNASFTETIPNAKQYALLDVVTNQFVQVNSNGQFTTNLNGLSYQVVGFNYTGTASGIIVGGTIVGVSASNLEISAGPIVKGCEAVTMQIEGVLYNDKDKNCKEGNDNQEGLPLTTIYLKLLNSSRQVIKVTSTDANAFHYFTFNADLIDGTYSIILDDNADFTDNTATYPAFWKGSAQTFTIVSGQIVEQLSNTPNFVPMCLQSSTEKPAPRKAANLQGNTYHFCFNQTATAINVDADSGAEINWYTSPTGGTSTKAAPVPNTKVIGVEVCYVSQTLNGAESDRTEIKIEVHPLPELPSVISGQILVGAETTQQYSIAASSSFLTYNWTLPSDWIGNSVTEQLNVIVGKQGGTIKVNAISANGCVGPEQQLDVRVVIEDDIEIYNSISPNGDGVNDELIIRNIDFYPNNTLEIYNRWGVLVYQADGYGQKDVLFKGFSDGRTTMNRNEELPEGTYFYTLMYVNSKGIQRQKAGYLYIKQ